jgi:orotate phosphoribosyltransferase-like protein
MALVAQGLANKEIAARLHLSEFTAKNHIHRIMKQMVANSRREAVDRLRASGRSLHLTTPHLIITSNHSRPPSFRTRFG